MLDTLQRWYWSLDRDVKENEALAFRWISWGTIRAMGHRRELDRRYFVVYLPGRYWERDGYRDEYAWHHRGLLWIQGECWGWHGWREMLMRCPDQGEYI